jgi:integrase
MNTITNDELLSKLTELVSKDQHNFDPIPTKDLLEAYLKSRKLHSETIRTYIHQFKPIIDQFPIFPSDHSKINEYIASLKCLNKLSRRYGQDASPFTKKAVIKSIKALLHFAVSDYNYPNYSEKIIKINTKGTPPRPFRTQEEILHLINSCHKPIRRLVILTLVDSACRIGELGITNEHDGLTDDRVHPDQECIEVFGKTGYHRMHCCRELCDLLLQNKSFDGHIFWTKRMPNGLTSGSLADMVHDIFVDAFKTGVSA